MPNSNAVQIDSDDSEKEFSELLEEYQTQEKMYRFESTTGLKDLNKICNAIGYQESPFAFGSSLEQFLMDNPGAMCAIVDWLSGANGESFKEELITHLNAPEGSDSEDDSED